MNAKYYIYRNLHLKDTFSVRFRGKVIDRLTDPVLAYDVEFKVSQHGRLQALQKKQRNVHAFCVAQTYNRADSINLILGRVCYNPFKMTTFMIYDRPIHHANSVLFINGQCYLVKE